MTTRALPVSSDVAQRLTGDPLLVMLDVDGTLAPIAPTPDAAAVPDDTKRIVAALARCRGVHVALVSGRGAADARRLVGVGHVWVIGNHGIELVSPSGDPVVDERVEPFRERIAGAASRLRSGVAAVPGVLLEDKQLTLAVHYRLADRAVLPRLERVVREVASEYGLRVAGGKEVFELRPPVEIDKGTAVLALAERLGGGQPGSALLFAGDDRTDEDAFRALRERIPRAVTIRVGEPVTGDGSATAAEFVIDDTDDVRTLLRWMLERGK
jgi:trehalose 6-phosphate phosphatase